MHQQNECGHVITDTCGGENADQRRIVEDNTLQLLD